MTTDFCMAANLSGFHTKARSNETYSRFTAEVKRVKYLLTLNDSVSDLNQKYFIDPQGEILESQLG